MSKIFSVLMAACFAFLPSTANAACQVPAPVPSPESEDIVRQDQFDAYQSAVQRTAAQQTAANSRRPLNVTPVLTNVRLQDNSQPMPAMQQASGETYKTPTPRPLPDIVKCCPLNSITLSKALSKVSRKNEVLPVPPNEAGDYLQSHGIQMAERVYGTSSLRHPEPVFYEHLYFEDPNLERCGAGHGIATELVSAVRFFGRAPLVPYMVGSVDKHPCVQSLGDCPVCHRYGKSAYLPALNARGVAFEAAAVIGLVFLLP